MSSEWVNIFSAGRGLKMEPWRSECLQLNDLNKIYKYSEKYKAELKWIEK